LICLSAWRARRAGQSSGLDVARGAGAGLYILIAGAAVLNFVRKATGVGSGWTEYRPLLARFSLFEAMIGFAALAVVLAAAAFAARGGARRWAAGVALAAGLGGFALGGLDPIALGLGVAGAIIAALSFGPPARLAGSWIGLLLTAFAAAVALQILAPTISLVALWPLAAAACLAPFAGARSIPGQGIGAVVAVAVLAWLGALFHFMLQGVDQAAAAAVPAWLAALVLWPLIYPSSREANAAAGATQDGEASDKKTPDETPRDETAREEEAPDEKARGGSGPALALAGAALVAALAIAVFLNLSAPWTPRHPNAVEPLYMVDPAAQKAWRVSAVPPDDWSRRALEDEGGAIVPVPAPFFQKPLPGAPARPVPAAAPDVAIATTSDGRVTITAAFHPGAARMFIAVKAPAAIRDVLVNGKPSDFAPKVGDWGRIVWNAPDGFQMSFRTAGNGRVEIRTAEMFDRWLSMKPLPALPATEQAWDMAGSSIVLGGATVQIPAAVAPRASPTTPAGSNSASRQPVSRQPISPQPASPGRASRQ
jgi:hypothetical protein